MHAREYKDVQLEHQLADSGGMNLVKWPKQFDVIVTDNLFGDMLSDIAAMLTGSLGMLPSASLGEVDVKTKKRKALYEPVHGSAPDIAGKGLANPIAMIASFGMALRYSFDMGALADQVDAGDRRGAGQGPAHRRHQVRRHDGGQHDADGRGDPERNAGAARVIAAGACAASTSAYENARRGWPGISAIRTRCRDQYSGKPADSRRDQRTGSAAGDRAGG